MYRPNSKRMKNYFEKFCFPSKCLSGGVGSSFHNFTETFVPKFGKYYAQSPSMYRTQKKVSEKTVSSKCFLNTKKLLLTTFLYIFWRKSESILITTRQKQNGVHHEVIFYQRVRLNSKKSVLITLQREISKSRKMFRLKSEYT